MALSFYRKNMGMDKLHKAFNVPIYGSKLELNTEEIEVFCKEYQQKHETRIKSNHGGYQSASFDNTHAKHHNPPVIKSLVNEIERSMLDIDPSPILVTDIWFNINGYKDHNIEHLHPGSIYSGVYYVKTPENCGSLTFTHPAIDLLLNFPDEGKDGLFKVTAEENLLYIFPSWLKHYVSSNMNTNNEERISLSFNTKLKSL